MSYVGFRVQCKESDNPLAVYVVFPNGASWIPDPSTAENLFGSSWSAGVQQLTLSQFETIPMASPLSSGAILAQGGGEPIYLVTNQQKRHIANMEVMDVYDFEDGTVVQVNPYLLSQVPDGEEIAA